MVGPSTDLYLSQYVVNYEVIFRYRRQSKYCQLNNGRRQKQILSLEEARKKGIIYYEFMQHLVTLHSVSKTWTNWTAWEVFPPGFDFVIRTTVPGLIRPPRSSIGAWAITSLLPSLSLNTAPINKSQERHSTTTWTCLALFLPPTYLPLQGEHSPTCAVPLFGSYLFSHMCSSTFYLWIVCTYSPTCAVPPKYAF